MAGPSFKEIGKFQLSGTELNDVLQLDEEQKVQYVPRRYVSRLTSEIGKIIPGRYLARGPSKTSDKIEFRFYKGCRNFGCEKLWKVTCHFQEFVSGKVEFKLHENEIICHCEQDLRPRPLTGHERDDIAKRLETASTAKLRRQLIIEGDPELLRAGLSTVPSTSGLHNLRFQQRVKVDLDEDPIIDVVKRSLGQNNDYIRQLTILPTFLVVLMKRSQVDVFCKWYENTKFRRAYLDATGSILAKVRNSSGKPLLHHALIFTYKNRDDNKSTTFNLAEMITSSQSMPTIANFLKQTIQLIDSDSDGKKHIPLFHEIVSDKSFANIGAILKAFNDTTLTEYLDLCYKILHGDKKEKKALDSLVVVRLCSSHTCKTMSDLVHLHFKDKKLGLSVCRLIGPLFDINNLDSVLRYAECLLFCLNSPKRGTKFLEAARTCLELAEDAVSLGLELFKEESDEKKDKNQSDEHAQEEDVELKQHQAIYSSSKCYQLLSEHLKNCTYDNSGEENKSFSPEFAQAFLKNHMSYVLLWGRPMTFIRDQTASRANNGFIEGYFKDKKNIFREDQRGATGSFGVVRVGRYINHYSDVIDSKVKQFNFGIPARRVPKNHTSSQKSSCSQRSSSSGSQRSVTDLTEAGVTQTQEKYGKRSNRPSQKKNKKFFGNRRSSSLE